MTPRYYPLRTGFARINPPEFPIDAKKHQPSYEIRIDRATRALERFRNFENHEATEEAMAILLDHFFEAAESIWHCKDWIQRALPKGRDDPNLKDLLRLEEQCILFCIANASKHAELSQPDRFFLGSIELTAPGIRLPSVGSMSDFYRRLKLHCEGRDPTHPTDFLEKVLNQWRQFALQHVWIPSISKPKATQATYQRE